MPESMLLLIEIAILALTAYFYWLTRKLVTGPHSPFLTSPRQRNKDEIGGMDQVEMMQDVATLLNEWQTATNATQEDWLRQQTGLQQTLSQAESITTELRRLIAQAETQKNLDVVTQKQAKGETSPQDNISTPIPPTLAEAILAFSNYLRASGYSQLTIIRTISRAQHFVTWLEEQISPRLPLRRLISTEIENYSNYLAVQPAQADSNVEREMSAIKIFATWINEQCDCQQPADTLELNHSAVVAPSPVQFPGSSGQIPVIQGAGHYQNVFTLADQGLGPAAITVETGLEREAVWLLLSRGPLSRMKN